MPIIEHDAWRQQYFTGVACPDHVVIPTDDIESYRLFPTHAHIYNKLNICLSQNIRHAPAGIAPDGYPVFSKPIVNLRGMGLDSYRLDNTADYEKFCRPGHFWMEYLEGEHVSTDAAIINGVMVWSRHTVGYAAGEGMFDYWHIAAVAKPELEATCHNWVRRMLNSYTGMVNIETIGGTIIEAQLRFADQWPDLYGQGWIPAMVTLYAEGKWEYTDADRRDGYSVVLFGAPGLHHAQPPAELIAALLRRPNISSIQITYDSDKSPASHAMPPGGFRLAIVNCWDRTCGEDVRRKLAAWFAGKASARRQV